MKPALIIHGHFYQPPRENPWTGIVDCEPSAAPAHDWNQRIHDECYRPNAYARIYDDDGTIRAVVNNYQRLSFNFGPTLLHWLERFGAQTYRRIIQADKRSKVTRGGHGNAIAQGYNHTILPLCNERDMRTQIRWGLAEFRTRFGRDAESLWMPETACDDRVLGALIDEGLRYALLAPNQAAAVREGDGWKDVSGGRIDPRRPYRYCHPDGSGRSIALFFYDGAISRAVAFEGVLTSSRALVDRFEQASTGAGSLVHVVTDGESYGHHFKLGERCLAYSLEREAERRGFWVTNYGELLDHMPAEQEVRIALGDKGRGSSWSCAHGVGRWIRDCGCHTGGKAGWDQKWRGPLRASLDLLRDEAAAFYEQHAGELTDDPWGLRDDYIELLMSPQADRGKFFEQRCGRRLSESEQLRALRLLQAQRSSMVMYTSCGWFFSDLAGIETVQILRYAGRLIDQLVQLGADNPESRFVEALAEASSNDPDHGSGADIYRNQVVVARATGAALAAHVSLSRLACGSADHEPTESDDAPTESGELAGHHYELETWREEQRGRLRVATACVRLTEQATGQHSEHACCAMHFGGVELHAVLRPFEGHEALARATARLFEALDEATLVTILRIAEAELGPSDYGLAHVLPSGREAISRALFADMRERYAAQYEGMYQDARRAIATFHDVGLPLPAELRAAAELALSYRFDDAIAGAPVTGFNPSAYREARAIAEQAQRIGCSLRPDAARAHLQTRLLALLHRVCSGDDLRRSVGGPVADALALLKLAEQLGVELDLSRAQERLFHSLRDGLEPLAPLAPLGIALGLSPRLFEPEES